MPRDAAPFAVRKRLKPRSVPARRAAQRRAKQPARSAAIAVAADGMRLPLPFHRGPPEGRFLESPVRRRTVLLKNRCGGSDLASKRSARVARATCSYSRSCSAGPSSANPGEDTSAKILFRNWGQWFTLVYE